jgi:hypothetical protein
MNEPIDVLLICYSWHLDKWQGDSSPAATTFILAPISRHPIEQVFGSYLYAESAFRWRRRCAFGIVRLSRR